MSMTPILRCHTLQPYRLVEYAPSILALGAVAFLPMQLAWISQRTYLSEWGLQSRAGVGRPFRLKPVLQWPPSTGSRMRACPGTSHT